MKAFHEVRSYAADFMVWQSSYENISFLAHWHPELELIYVHSGAARLSVGNSEFTANAGDLVLVDTGEFHYSDSFDYKNHLDFIVFDPTIISPHYHPSNFVRPLVTSGELQQYGMAESTTHLFASVHQELEQKSPYYREIVSAMLREFFYRLRRLHPRCDDALAAHTSRTDMLCDLRQLLTYIDEHYSEDISLSFAAQKMNFSESHFSKMFKKLVGLNFVHYLNAVRIEQAASLLRASGTRISDIALSCGFENVRSFNRTFKDYTGYTPTQFLRLPDAEALHFSYYNRRKTTQKEFVQDDSLTVVKNPPR